jgi:hypothetical protein
MNSAICTLFEGDYHYGVGALVNSLHRHGYRGIVWAGYRGILPQWASPLRKAADYVEFDVGNGCVIRFLTIGTERHLTNHKPEFMLDVGQHRCPDTVSLYYFDPDIVIKCAWAFFEEWTAYGVAVCEDVNSPMPASHPIRHAWRRFCAEHGVPLPRFLDAYVSGGFVGLRRSQFALLEMWKQLVDALESETGDLKQIGYRARPYAFYNGDQDVLNMTLMSSDEPISLIGREGMDFAPGGYTMSHAAGGVKPWRKRLIASALSGIPPTRADKEYWRNVERPIRLYSTTAQRWHWWNLVASSAVGRFIRRV